VKLGLEQAVVPCCIRPATSGFPNDRVVHATLRPISNGVLQLIYIFGNG
jgi:hypothetical protein